MTKLKIVEVEGDLFDAPTNSLIVHACNCQGSWNAGIAKVFKEKYPWAYIDYQFVCNRKKRKILGKAHMSLPIKLIESDNADIDKDININTHFIGCLFTSYYYGKLRDSQSQILEATKSSMQSLLEEVTNWNTKLNGYTKVKEIRMCRINSGLFGIPWNQTKDIIQSIDADCYIIKHITVVSV